MMLRSSMSAVGRGATITTATATATTTTTTTAAAAVASQRARCQQQLLFHQWQSPPSSTNLLPPPLARFCSTWTQSASRSNGRLLQILPRLRWQPRTCPGAQRYLATTLTAKLSDNGLPSLSSASKSAANTIIPKYRRDIRGGGGSGGSGGRSSISSSIRSSSSSQQQPRQPKQQQQQQQQKQPTSGSRNERLTSLPPPEETSSIAPPTPLAHENIYTIPNILTFSRLFLTPVIGYLVVEGSHPGLALSLLCYAGVTDLADGWIARRWNLGTVVGSVIDPMADKALMTVLTVALAANGALPVWLAAIILGRDVGLGISAIYYRWISLPPPKTFTRYWDFSLPSAEVRPTTISKYNTFLQFGLVGLATAQPIVEPWTGVDVGGFLDILQYVVAITTIWSGASYVFSKDAVRILGQQTKSTKRK